MGLHLKSRKQNGHRMKSSCKSPLRELGNKCDWLCAIGYAAQEHLRGAPISRRAWQSFELKRFQDPNCQSVVPMGVTKLVLGKSNFSATSDFRTGVGAARSTPRGSDSLDAKLELQ